MAYSPGNGANALTLDWSFGFNKDIKEGVHDLSDGERSAIFYASAHTGVIYDYSTEKQQLLQGHCNQITACCVSRDKRWIITADSGPESMVVVWDSLSGEPVKTIFQPHTTGVVAMDLSADATHLVTLSSVEEEIKEVNDDGSTPRDNQGQQEISVWSWPPLECDTATSPGGENSITSSQEHGMVCSSVIETNDVQHCVKFHKDNEREIVSNGSSRVVFWDWSNGQLLWNSPPLSVKDFRQKVGKFTQSLFLPHNAQAITATVDGDIILWDRTLTTVREPLDTANEALLAAGRDRRAVKIVKLNNTGAILFFGLQNDMLVTGGYDGSVRFYDLQFRIVAWFEDLGAGPIMGVSFSNTAPTTCNTINGTFTSPDFVACTSKGMIMSVSAASFQELSADKRRGKTLVQGFSGPLVDTVLHPEAPLVFVLTSTGDVQAWNYETKRICVTKTLRDDSSPVCAAMDINAEFLVVGCSNGTVRVLRWSRSQDLGELACFAIRPGVAITRIKFSPDGAFLAIADADHCVGLYRYETPLHTKSGQPLDINRMLVDKGKAAGRPGPGLEPSDGESRAGWTYLGRHKSHHAAITAIDFVPSQSSNSRQQSEEDSASPEEYAQGDGLGLVSVAEDRTMVEYDIDSSAVGTGLPLVGKPMLLEQTALPTCCLFQPQAEGDHEQLVLTCNSEYKIKAWNRGAKVCRWTSLGPTFASPLNCLKLIPTLPPSAMDDNDADVAQEEDETDMNARDSSENIRYLAYSTAEKVVGLIQLPFNGNPHKSIGLVAHPGHVTGIDVSYDGKYMVTAGGQDLALNLWRVDTGRLGRAVDRAGQGVEPFLDLIEGGAQGELVQQISDFFHYAQLRSQGEDSMAPREVTGTVPVEDVPDLMRALGYYPSDREIHDMTEEVRYSEFAKTGTIVEFVTLDTFVRLYVNHRSVFGVGQQQIHDALEVIRNAFGVKGAKYGEGQQTVSLMWQTLVNALENQGEPVESVDDCLALLMPEVMPQPTSVVETNMLSSGILGFEQHVANTSVMEQESGVV